LFSYFLSDAAEAGEAVRHVNFLKGRIADPHCDFVGAVLRANFTHLYIRWAMPLKYFCSERN
jgi:hypothetical protein